MQQLKQDEKDSPDSNNLPTSDNQVIDSSTLKKRMEVCIKEGTEARLHQFIVLFFNLQPINQFRSHASLNSWTNFPRSIKVAAEEFNISPLWVMLANNL
jgi:hypothetical protein